MADYQQFDNEESLREAKRRLPLDRLMQQHGDNPPPIGMKWGPCPICKKKTTARITDGGQQLFFKCANDNCPSATAGEGNAWTELHYLGFKTGFTGKEVFIAYLKMANVWREVEKHKGPAEARVRPEGQKPEGEQPTTNIEQPTSNGDDGDTAPQKSDDGGQKPDEGTDDDEEVIQKCIEVILAENRASVSLLQRRLRLGYTRAGRIMGELEKRGLVGPARGAEPREILIPRPELPKTAEQLLTDDIAKFVEYVQRAEKRKFNFIDIEGAVGFARAKEVFAAMKERKIISPLGDGGDLELTPKPGAHVQIISSAEAVKPTPKIGGEDGYAALHDFFNGLTLSEQDEALLFHRRGLTTATSAALRFRSNPRVNRGRLLDMLRRFEKEELLDSGLFVRVKGKPLIKPYSQFCGAGIIRKLKPGEEPERNQWVDNDGNLWGWCEPVLIPYFDETGRIIGLRPHKGNAQGSTLAGAPRVYIPRAPRDDNGKAQEIFPRVVITEGEFKAAALYQTIGAGRGDGGEPYGVVALPGIWFGQNYAVREELDQWLRDVRCRVVKVAYDNEDKSNPELESFKTDRRKRFDAEICARVIATDVANKLHIRGEVCRLPDAWRNEKGKADWDGALVKITQPEEKP